MTNRIKSVGPIEEEDIERRGVTFEDFSETSEKKGGSGRGTVLAKAILLRLEKVVTGIGEALLNQTFVYHDDFAEFPVIGGNAESEAVVVMRQENTFDRVWEMEPDQIWSDDKLYIIRTW